MVVAYFGLRAPLASTLEDWGREVGKEEAKSEGTPELDVEEAVDVELEGFFDMAEVKRLIKESS